MTRLMSMVMIALTMTAACGRQEVSPETAAPASTSAPSGPVEITLTPEQPVMGMNDFEATVTQGGQPVDDAQVSVELSMAAMPSMNMAEMRTTADLAPAGYGIYRGEGQVMMSGDWDVTVTATRNGQPLATKKLTVTAQ